VRLNSDEQIYDASFSNHLCPDLTAVAWPTESPAPIELPYQGQITIGPYAVLILSQESGG
jgi:hypothetical protein